MEKMFGVMLDCSRNGVLTPAAVKNFADIISKMGYNMLMLYTEDTYEIETQPFFGHLRGRYSKKELRDIDDYCKKIGIELIPCIQTLAHLRCMFQWRGEYGSVRDCEDILLVGEEKTYLLIDDMFKTISECFSSKKIHIGMDEAYQVGNGTYLQRNGARDRFDIINEHLHKVCEIASKYSLKPMIWSDMFCRLATGQGGTGDQYAMDNAEKILEKAALPENVSLVYWDYYHTDYNHYVQSIKKNKLFDRKVYFGGGAWTWRGFAPDNAYSMEITDAAISACKDENVDGIFLTMWGDDGAECSPFAILPALMFASEKMHGNSDEVLIKAKFREITGADFDNFMLLDTFDTPGEKHTKPASKYLLYNDPFMGIRDFRCSDEDNEYYAKLADKLHKMENKGEFSEMFDSYEKLAELLCVKAALGVKTRKAYLENNKE